MGDLGDISGFLDEGGPVNLEWLKVDDASFYEAHVPQQNLDTVPDLKALWRHRDESPMQFVPNSGQPLTMRDVAIKTASSDEVIKAARWAIIETTDAAAVKTALEARFTKEDIRANRVALAKVFAERGLLGPYYLDAQDFSECHKGQTAEIRRLSASARYLLAKSSCADCAQRQEVVGIHNHCSVFCKKLGSEVPYTHEDACVIEGLSGKVASQGSPRERIRSVLLAKAATTQSYTGRQQIPRVASAVSSSKVLAASDLILKNRKTREQAAFSSDRAKSVVRFVRRELLKGRRFKAVLGALRLAFDARSLTATRSEWAAVLKESGLFGSVYTTQDSFEDCHEGANFLARHASLVHFVVAGQKCEGCVYNQANKCLVYDRRLLASREDLLTDTVVSDTIEGYRMAGKLPWDTSQLVQGNPEQDLRRVHEAASKPWARSNTFRGTLTKAFAGSASSYDPSSLARASILKTARRYLNEGLYGSELFQVLKSQFDPRELRAVVSDLRVVLAEQGLQGIKYIDPSVYDDYGSGCGEAGRKHGSRTAVEYAKVGSACATCSYQTRPGYCSVLAKLLVEEPPYIDKKAEQRAILSSGPATKTSYAELVNNGLTMLEQYNLQHTAMEIPEASPTEDFRVELGAIKLA